jgi:hypothetical protein
MATCERGSPDQMPTMDVISSSFGVLVCAEDRTVFDLERENASLRAELMRKAAQPHQREREGSVGRGRGRGSFVPPSDEELRQSLFVVAVKLAEAETRAAAAEERAARAVAEMDLIRARGMTLASSSALLGRLKAGLFGLEQAAAEMRAQVEGRQTELHHAMAAAEMRPRMEDGPSVVKQTEPATTRAQLETDSPGGDVNRLSPTCSERHRLRLNNARRSRLQASQTQVTELSQVVEDLRAQLKAQGDSTTPQQEGPRPAENGPEELAGQGQLAQQKQVIMRFIYFGGFVKSLCLG